LQRLSWLKGIVSVPEVGDVYDATVKSVMPYGAFVEFMPGKQGLLHISEISHARLETMEGVLKENQIIKVKLVGVDSKTGKFKLSAKALLEKEQAN
jgi:polyribonucleotide nucleotidyltransferase